MAYAIKDDKTKGNIVRVSHTFPAGVSSGVLSYTMPWTELASLGITESDFLDGKWIVISCYEEYVDSLGSDRRFRTAKIVDSTTSKAFPSAEFRPANATHSLVLEAYGSGWKGQTLHDVTVYVILMKIA